MAVQSIIFSGNDNIRNMKTKSNDEHRVLVTTVGAWSDSVGSNTMSELFRDYPKDKLSCLYIRANRSDSSSCHHYFHILEGRVLKSIIKRNVATGEEYWLDDTEKPTGDLGEEKARYDKFRKKKNWFYLFAREFAWLLGRWRTKELDSFLDEFNPEVLVCPIESYIHFNRINEYIIQRKHPRVIGFLWDDNFTYKQHKSIGYKLHRWWLRHGVKRLVKQCETVVALSPKMKEEADAFFGINSVLLTKPIFNQPAFVDYTPSVPLKMLYTGNLYVGRDETIAVVVDAIRKINCDKQRVILDIYTAAPIKPELENRIKVDGCCIVHDPIKQSEVLELQKQADVLLFVESLNNDGSGAARLSFSTKITDYFCAGKCIWAVGTNQLSAIDYLEKQDAALCSVTKEAVAPTLEKLVSNVELVREYAFKGWQCGHEKHEANLIISKLNIIINS